MLAVTGKLEWNQTALMTMTTAGPSSFQQQTTSGIMSSNHSEDGVPLVDDVPAGPAALFNWSFICVLVFVVAGTLGNVLVCLAVWLERPLQNVTNWFLVSLAFADLIVSTIVMPFGATAGFLGNTSLTYHLLLSIRPLGLLRLC